MTSETKTRSMSARGMEVGGPRGRFISKTDKSFIELLPEDLQGLKGSSSNVAMAVDRNCAALLPRNCTGEDCFTCGTSRDSSPPRFPVKRVEKASFVRSLPFSEAAESKNTASFIDKREKENEISEMDMMKERYAKLLLGEDMSGGGKGVSSALAISNAITNLSASVFGEIWRLEPFSKEKRAMWKREMDWLLAVSDHIVELVPSQQVSVDGSMVEVMVTKARSDLQMNLPALRKLDTMLLESLDSFTKVEFWYTDGASKGLEGDRAARRRDEKWWLPAPHVPIDGLSARARKHLQHQRECISQILKAALAINGQILSEMEVPSVYFDALPKHGKSSLGETMYRVVTAEHCSPESILSSYDLSSEHKVLDFMNKVEAAVHTWRRKSHTRIVPSLSNKDVKFKSWALAKELGSDDKRELYADRAESLLMMLRQKLPGLPQTILDMSKIQYNKDVGQSILESYSRVLECLAFNIISRIDDVLHIDDITKKGAEQTASLSRSMSAKPSSHSPFYHRSPKNKLSASPVTMRLPQSPRLTLTTHSEWTSPTKKAFCRNLSDWTADKGLEFEFKQMLQISGKQALPVRLSDKSWSYMGNINSLRSPPSRD